MGTPRTAARPRQHGYPQPPRPPRRRAGRGPRIFLLACASALTIVIIAVSLSGGGKPATPEQRCASAMQAYSAAGLTGDSPARIRRYGSPDDQRILMEAQQACDSLAPAQQRKAVQAAIP
jgi:hypothetical protein